MTKAHRPWHDIIILWYSNELNIRASRSVLKFNTDSTINKHHINISLHTIHFNFHWENTIWIKHQLWTYNFANLSNNLLWLIIGYYKLYAVREQQDPPWTLLSQTSTIFPEGYNFKYEQDRKKIWNHIRRLECGLHNVNYGDSQINLFCLTHNNISLINGFLTTFLSHNVLQCLYHNGFLTTAFS